MVQKLFYVYQTMDEGGHKAWVYILDQEMKMDKIGFFSTNLAEKISNVVTENSYHAAAEIISSTSGISHGGAWLLVKGWENVFQKKRQPG